MPKIVALSTMFLCDRCRGQGPAVKVACRHGGTNDKIWGAAVIETDPFAPVGAKWRYTSFDCRRGRDPNQRPKPQESERDAMDLWRKMTLQKEREGYWSVDWTDPQYNMALTVNELGTLPGREPPVEAALRPHDFTYGGNRNDIAYCRICGKPEEVQAHGFKMRPPASSETAVTPANEAAEMQRGPHPFVVSPASRSGNTCECGRVKAAVIHKRPPLPGTSAPAAPEPIPPIEVPDLARRRERRVTGF